MYKIQLSNGQALDNLTLNGNNFISASKVEDTVFDGGLSSVTFTDTDTGKSPKKVSTLEADVETLKTGYAAEFAALDAEYTKGVNSL